MTKRISLFFIFACRYKIGLLRRGLTLAVCLLFNAGAIAQSTAQCPANIGFEDGTFANWKAYSGTVSVNRSVNPPAQVTVIDPQPVNYPETVDITRSYFPLQNIKYSYWKDAKATVPLPNPKAVNRDNTFYIKATNPTGCFTIAPVVVDIIYEGIVIPNTFTPNGDGVNDQLTVLIDNAIKIKSFKIFNKWGEVVFTTTDIYNYWDGTKRGEPLPLGVYYWMVDGVNETEMKVRKGGSVTVLK